MPRLRLILTAALLWLAPLAAADTQGQAACPGTLMPRLSIGAMGRVTPGDPNLLRAAPRTSAPFLTNIPGGGTFIVLDGPTCADGYTWWKILHEGMVGWTAEAGAAYWLEPVAGAPDFGVPVAVAAEGVSLVYASALGSPMQQRFVPEGAAPAEREALELLLDPFAVTNEANTPASIRLYSAAAFTARYPTLAANVLAWFNGETEALPVGPQAEVRRDTRTLIARPARVDFVGGRGLRLISFTGRAGERVDSTELVYEFFGLTDDGATVLVATFPVLAPPLDALRDPGGDYPAYLRGIQIVLESTRPSGFRPSLDTLDALLLSLRVEGGGG